MGPGSRRANTHPTLLAFVVRGGLCFALILGSPQIEYSDVIQPECQRSTAPGQQAGCRARTVCEKGQNVSQRSFPKMVTEAALRAAESWQQKWFAVGPNNQERHDQGTVGTAVGRGVMQPQIWRQVTHTHVSCFSRSQVFWDRS